MNIYGIDGPNDLEVSQQALDQYNVTEKVKQEEAIAEQQKQQAAQQEAATQAEYKSKMNPDGTIKSSQETMDPKKFGVMENAQELGNAVVGGAVDIYNSIGSIPKFFDPNFYKQDNPENPYEFKAPWLITDKPITRTVWGNVIRTGVEFIGGAVGVGKIGWGIKGVQGLAKAGGLVNAAGKATTAGRIAGSAAAGATYDVISNQSQQSNVAAAILEVKPEWSSVLAPIATTDDMSPAQRSFYNVFEGLGLGAIADVAMEGVGAAARGVKSNLGKAKARITDPAQSTNVSKISDAVDRTAELEYDRKGQVLMAEARQNFEQAAYNKLVEEGALPVDLEGKVTSFAEWRKFVNKNGANPWNKLDEAEQLAQTKALAGTKGVDWGERDFTRRAEKQGATNLEVAEEQLLDDLEVGTPRENPAYMKGGDVTDHQELTNTSIPLKGVRDQIRIRNEWPQRDGAPRGPLSAAQIRRMEYGAPGMTQEEIDKLADGFAADPMYQELYGGRNTPSDIKEDFKEMAGVVQDFLDDSGHSRIIDVAPEQLTEFVDSLRFLDGADKESKIEGVNILNHAQLVATDLVIGQLLTGARDLARAALSVSDQVDVAAPGSILDGIMARYATLGRMRKETSMMSSWNLRRFKEDVETTIDDITVRTYASDAVAAEVETLKTLLRDDVDDNLLQTFLHFSATGGHKPQTFKDLQEFMRRKLHGYREGDTQYRNQLINELQITGVNSILSGPKTPVRAVVGTGLGTIMRPVSTIIGSLGGTADPAITRSSFAALGGMMESLGEAWQKAVMDFRAYNQNAEGWRGITMSTRDYEFEALKAFHYQYGSDGDKAMITVVDSIHNLNKLPIFNYGPRIMAAGDTFFSQLIGRGRMRQLAYLDTYDQLKAANKVVSDVDMDRLVREAERKFESKVFDADGQIADEMAAYAADEAKLTKELTGFAKAIDHAFDKAPYLKPFMLFIKTGVNALEMTAKHTPVLNRFVKEHADIMSKNWDDPAMLQYGIKSANDLEIAKATMRGRVAVGYGVVGTAAMMALNGQITGNGPPDRELRESWKQFGWKPRSIKIGDTYVSYESLEPFNLMLSFIADVADSQKVMGDEWVGNNLGKLSYLVAQNIINKTFMAGIFQLQELFTSNGQRIPSIAANLVNNQVPLAGMRNELGKLFSPGMRELENGFVDGIRNRNLYIDLLAGKDGKLPYRYDILNGQPLNDNVPLVRMMNSVNPFYVNPATNPTRELLFRSGVDLKLTFNTGPNNESLEGRPDLKSKWQYYVSQQNIEAQLENLFKDRQVVQSILDMEEDRAAGRRYEASETFHVPLIEQVLKNAKTTAWAQLMNDSTDLQELNNKARLEALSGKLRKQGDRGQANNIEQILSIAK